MITRAPRAYRWIGLAAGISDRKSDGLLRTLALWNGADPILTERISGYRNDGNHGRCEEYYFSSIRRRTHLHASISTNSPQASSFFPTRIFRGRNEARQMQPEFELLDTGYSTIIATVMCSLNIQGRYRRHPDPNQSLQTAVPETGPSFGYCHDMFRNTWSLGNEATRRPEPAESRPAPIRHRTESQQPVEPLAACEDRRNCCSPRTSQCSTIIWSWESGRLT